MRSLTSISVFFLLSLPLGVEAQQAHVYRVGIVLVGGQTASAIDGLRDEFGKLGLQEGKQFVLHVSNVKGDLKLVEAAAKRFEEQKADLIWTINTSVTLPAKRATSSIPIVFYVGTDPVSVGLVQSLRKPGGRLTGLYSQVTALTAKRVELLKEMVPGIHRVVAFYRPNSPVTRQSVEIARDAARRLKLQLLERPVGSVDELRGGLRALDSKEADALVYVSDAMVASQADMIIEAAREKKLPTMFQERGIAAKGALAAYGESFYVMGRLSARYVHRILLGADPAGLPVEQVDTFHFVVNLKTAKDLGIKIPQSVLVRANEIIE